jgi:Tfp pilus assembly protein PilO
MRAQLDDVEARRARLEADLALQVDTARREVAAAHATEVLALRAHAAAQVETAVRDARDEAARTADETARRHAAALAALRAERDDIAARCTRLEQDVDVDATRRRQAAIAHAAEIAALQAETDARIEAAVHDARDDAARAAAELAHQHAAALETLRLELDAIEACRATLERDLPNHIDTARRDAAAVHAADVAALRAQAAAHVELAIRDVRDEAARAAAETAGRHAAALAALRDELDATEARRARLDQDLAVQMTLRREASAAHTAGIAALETQATTQLDAAVGHARDEAARSAAGVAAQHALALDTLRAELAESEARRTRLERELPIHVEEVRSEAEATHAAAIAALKAQAAAQVEAAVREVREETSRTTAGRSLMVNEALDSEALVLQSRTHPASAVRVVAVATAALVLSGLAGSLVGWSVILSGLFY